MNARSVLVVCLVAALAEGARAETPCNDCWNDTCQELKGIFPKCKPPPKKTPPKGETGPPKVPGACSLGQERNADTAGQCCWPGQAWNGARCVGIPASCPASFTIDSAKESCVLPSCEEGMKRALDGVHCCWPGQAWSSSASQCLGEPQCAKGWALEERRCISPEVLQAREQAQRLAAEEAARAAAAEAARVQAAEEERVRLEQERERVRKETEQREAALKAERERAEAAARAEQEERAARERAQQREREEATASAALQRGLASGLGALSVASIAVAGITSLGGVLTNAEIAGGTLDDADAIEETAERGQLFNTITWGTLVGGGVGIVGSIVWYAVAAPPEPQ